MSLDNTLGAIFLGNIFTTILFGITSQQSFTYFKLNSAHDSAILKYQIGVLWALHTLHIAFITHAVYRYSVSQYNDRQSLVSLVWSIFAQIYVTSFSQLLVRGIFASRVWIISGRKTLVVAVISFFSVLNATTGIAMASTVLQKGTFVAFWDIKPIMYINLASGAAADFSIAAFLCTWLLKSRTGFKKTDSLVNTLMAYAINTGLLTTICNILSLFTYAFCKGDFIFLAFFFVLPELSLNAMLASFNARKCMQTKARTHVELAARSSGSTKVQSEFMPSNQIYSPTGSQPLVIDVTETKVTSVA